MLTALQNSVAECNGCVPLRGAAEAGSTSPVLTQTVNKVGTNTALTSSPNPSAVGQAVTFTATVTSASGGGTPIGTVTFMDGA
jgi:hypothetical protein